MYTTPNIPTPSLGRASFKSSKLYILKRNRARKASKKNPVSPLIPQIYDANNISEPNNMLRVLNHLSFEKVGKLKNSLNARKFIINRSRKTQPFDP
jgi:hypothetical protein